MCNYRHEIAQPAGQPRAGDGRPLRGGLSFVTPEVSRNALHLARTGTVVPLNLPLDSPTIGRPQLVHRARMHNQMRPLPGGRFNVVNDDLVELALQSHSHWDALAHWGVSEADGSGVFYAGVGLDDTGPEFGSKSLGIGTLSGGIVTRGVLFDMVSHVAGPGARFLDDDQNITRSHVETYLEEHDITLRQGDAALFYTGFQERLRARPDLFANAAPGQQPVVPGILVETMPIWEQAQTFALVADNPSVEPNPMGEGLLHAAALKRLGIYLGELFDLETLVARCRATGRSDFVFVSIPLNIPKAFGSPANAIAIL
jgi:kynurenine formamidase